MKKLFMTNLLALTILMTTISSFGQTKTNVEKGNVETKMMVIKGNTAWLNTGFLLNPSDRVTITASGRVYFSNGENLSGIAPMGMRRQEYTTNWELDSQYCNDPEMLINHAALIGKVGKETFPIGISKTVTGKKGPFSIGINDCTFTGQYYNTGEFRVNIKVYRGK